MRRVVYPGTFDPITLGHIEIIQHASALFDDVTVAILHNPKKSPMFDVAERKALVEQATQAFGNVHVDAFSGLLVHYVREKELDAVVRGVRDASDLQVEMQMAQMNEALYTEMHTLFIPTSAKFSYVSSSLVKDVVMHGGDVTNFVPDHVRQALLRKVDGR